MVEAISATKKCEPTDLVIVKNGGNVMVNATQMAKAFGKQPNDWLKTEQAQRMIEAIAASRNLEPTDNQLVIAKKGGQSNSG